MQQQVGRHPGGRADGRPCDRPDGRSPERPDDPSGGAGCDVAGRVRQVIGEAGCSQREFARRITMDPSTLSRSLTGTRRFTVAELARIADAGQVDAGWLLGTGPSAAAGRAARVPRPRGARPASAAERPVPEGGRRLQIVRETVRLIAERGFHAVRVSDIATACRTSTAAIHYHFPGRAELLEAAVRWCMDQDAQRRAERIAEADDAGDELRQLIALQTPRTAQQRRQWAVWLDLWAEAARSTAIGRLHAEFYRQWRRTVADVIRRGVAQGVFRSVDPEASALRLTALIDGLATAVLATAPGEDGTTAADMHAACLAHVDAELTARPTARPAGTNAPVPDAPAAAHPTPHSDERPAAAPPTAGQPVPPAETPQAPAPPGAAHRAPAAAHSAPPAADRPAPPAAGSTATHDP